MARKQVSVRKRERDQKKRERDMLKAERAAEKKEQKLAEAAAPSDSSTDGDADRDEK
jgi:hypothetical protein